jgi:hypothetical protein
MVDATSHGRQQPAEKNEPTPERSSMKRSTASARQSAAALGACLACGALAAASAETATQSVRLTATVRSATRLTLSATTITFPDAHPDDAPRIPADENAVSVTAKARTRSDSEAVLTVLAPDDLTSGSNRIGIENVSWTAVGGGFRSGRLSKGVPQTVGKWTGPGVRTGSLSYFLTNRFEYATGNYTATLVYTLTAP